MEATVKKIISLLVIALFSLGTSATVAAAEYRWVSDILYVPLRSGKGNQFRIVDSALKTGTRLAVLSEDVEGGWTEVRTDDGRQGYIRSQFLITTPTAAQQLAQVQQKLTRLETDNQKLRQQLNSTQSDSQQLDQSLAEERKQAEALQAELEELKRISTGAVSLHQRHEKLTHDHQLIQTELDIIKAENERLKEDDRNTFFLYGAGAVGLGVLIALVAPSLRRRKRYSDWA